MVGISDSFNDGTKSAGEKGYANPAFRGDVQLSTLSTVDLGRTRYEQNERAKEPGLANDGPPPSGKWQSTGVAAVGVGTGAMESGADKDYDPYDYCTSEKPTSYADTLFHLLKAAVGTGILAIPSAFKEAGYGVGVGGIIFMAFLYAYSIHLLIAAEHELCRRRRVPNMTYANTVRAAFEDRLPKHKWLAAGGQFFANFFFMVYESGGCAIYIVFIASNLKQLLDYHLHSDVALTAIIVGITVPMVFVCWIRNLKLLAPLSAAANVIIAVCFGLVFFYVFREPPSFANRRVVGSPAKLPVYLTTVLFAIASTGLILPLKSEMKKPAQFGQPTGVLNMSMIPMTILYAVFGLFGYLKYGDNVAGSITLNLPRHEWLAQCIKGLYSLSVFISYHLCYYVVLDIVWKNFLKDKVRSNHFVCEYVVRTIIPIITMLMAIAVPNLETFISLVGALGISTTSLVIPVIIHTLTFWDHHKTKLDFYRFLVRNAVLLAISIIIFTTGIIESAIDVMELWRK